MRILLINPPYLLTEMYPFELHDIGSLTPPLGLAYLAASLQEKGYRDIKIIDCSILDMNLIQLQSQILQINPDFIGITCTTVVIDKIFDMAKMLKNILPEVHITVGGPHASIFKESMLHECPSIDSLVVGEGEITIVKLIEAIERKISLKEIGGISFRENGMVKTNPPQEIVEDLDTLPLPARDLLPMDKYISSPASSKKSPQHTIISSRGCPANCKFCSVPFRNSFRAHGAKRIVDEMAYLIKNFAAKEILFWDACFTASRKRTIELCEEIRNRGLRIPWTCATRVDKVDRDLLRQMKQAGCWEIEYGVEAGSRETLKKMDKRINIGQVEQSFRWTRECGISIRATFMLAYPGETRKDIELTKQLARELRPDIAKFNITVAYPGSELYDYLVSSNIKIPWLRYKPSPKNEGEIPFVPIDMTADEIYRLWKETYKEFYFNLGYILSRLLKLKTVGDIRRYWRGYKAIRQW